MGLRITMKPIDTAPPYINLGNTVKVVDIESGVDLSDSIKDIDIIAHKDTWVTANIEFYVGELDMDGVDIRSEVQEGKFIFYKDRQNRKQKSIFVKKEPDRIE